MFRKGLTVLAMVFALTAVAAPAAQASSAHADSDVGVNLACGYTDNDHGWAVYRHCGPFNVVIFVDSWGPFTDYYLCVAPGDTTLGATWLVNNAYYVPGGEWCHR